MRIIYRFMVFFLVGSRLKARILNGEDSEEPRRKLTETSEENNVYSRVNRLPTIVSKSVDIESAAKDIAMIGLAFVSSNVN